ncbi:MAG: hypothetical protein QM503_06175 [Bacteroidota bacterium]
MRLTTISLLILFFASTLSAQNFSTMINNENIAWLRDYTITTADGDVYETEKLSSYSAANGRLKSLSFKTKDGVKHKLKADEISEVRARLTKFAKAATISDNATKSIKSAVTTDYAGIIAENLVRFNSVEYNKKKGKKAMLQLINWGFDQKLKVYPDPASESGTTSVTGIAVSGGQIKSYFIVKGDQTFTVNKKSYKKLYNGIYGDCSEMEVNPKSITIKNLAQDILKYNSSCNTK